MVVLIVGASGGLGQVLARTLVSKGLVVYGTMRNPDNSDRNLPYTMLPMDVTDAKSVEACVQKMLELEGRIDVLINCANDMMIGSIDEASIEEVRSLYEINVFGALRVCREVLPAMREQGSGTIVNMSSLGGLLAVPYMSAYTSAKFALEALSEALYHEVKPHNIDVVIMQPVAMRMDRPAVGAHLRMVEGAGADSFSHNVAAQMAKDTVASKLTPEMVSEKIFEVITRDKKRLRVPMDRAKAVTLIKRVAPQSVIDRLIGGLMKSARSLKAGSSTTG